MIIDIIGLEQENTNYRNSSVTCTVNLGNRKIGDLSLARKDHELQIPINKKDENVQFIIFPMTNPKNRIGKLLNVEINEYLMFLNLGSLSIPVHNFLELSINEKYEQWFTLFDYLEDDIFDGTLGENDSESPMIQIRYHLSDKPVSRRTTEN